MIYPLHYNLARDTSQGKYHSTAGLQVNYIGFDQTRTYVVART